MYSYLYLNFSNYGPRTSSRGITKNLMDFPGGSDVKQSTCNVRDLGSILGLGRYSGARHGNAFRNSYLENPMDRGALQATVRGISQRVWTPLGN